MMARLNNCAACSANSFRALHGCLHCARQTMRRYKDADDELASAYRIAQKEVSAYLFHNTKKNPPQTTSHSKIHSTVEDHDPQHHP